MLQSWSRSLTTKRFINFVFHNTRLNPLTLCDLWSLHYNYKYSVYVEYVSRDSVYVEYVSRELQDWLWVLDNLCIRQWNKCIQAVESLELVLQQQFSPTSQVTEKILTQVFRGRLHASVQWSDFWFSLVGGENHVVPGPQTQHPCGGAGGGG